MRTAFAVALLAIAALLGGCAGTPQLPVAVSQDFLAAKGTRVGVAMTPLPTVDTYLPGADCLLCMAAASLMNSSLTAHVKTLPHEDLPPLKADIAALLRSKGLDATVVDKPIDLNALPDFSSKEPNFAAKDFSSLKSQLNVDRLLVIDISALGAWRTYSAYIPTSDPKAVLRGTGYIVNLSNNALDWYLPVNILKSAEQSWDEPPKFPGLTNAYFQAIEIGKDTFKQPFQQ